MQSEKKATSEMVLGIVHCYLNILAVPVVLFWKQDSLFGKWLYFVLLLFDTRLQSHHSAEKTDKTTILISGFDKEKRCVPSTAYVLY